MCGPGTVESTGSTGFEREDLILRYAKASQEFVWSVEKELRRRLAAEMIADATVNGRGGTGVQLLVEDGFEERLEWRGTGIEAQGKGTGPVNERAEVGIRSLEVPEGRIGIKGKLAAAAIVDHGRSVSHGWLELVIAR